MMENNPGHNRLEKYFQRIEEEKRNERLLLGLPDEPIETTPKDKCPPVQIPQEYMGADESGEPAFRPKYLGGKRVEQRVGNEQDSLRQRFMTAVCLMVGAVGMYVAGSTWYEGNATEESMRNMENKILLQSNEIDKLQKELEASQREERRIRRERDRLRETLLDTATNTRTPEKSKSDGRSPYSYRSVTPATKDVSLPAGGRARDRQ